MENSLAAAPKAKQGIISYDTAIPLLGVQVFPAFWKFTLCRFALMKDLH